MKIIVKGFGFALLVQSYSWAMEFLRPISAPYSSVATGTILELRDDVYSLDARLSTELAVCRQLSFYSDVSYRFFSYQWEILWRRQLHEMLDLQVNGFNESYLGMKWFPLEYVGVAANFRFVPGEGSQKERFPRWGLEPMAFYPISAFLYFGAAFGFYSFLERDNFQPGMEIGEKFSLVWKPFYKISTPNGLRISYVFLLRHRIQESKNLNMLPAYQKMDDEYSGFRMRVQIAYGLKSLPFEYGFAYEMSRGLFFGFETGHRMEFFLGTSW